MLLELNESVLSVLSKADVVIAAPGHPSEADFPTMVTIMYMLRRGNRMETLTAVKQLTMLCCGAESYVDIATKVVIKASTMREMRAAGALQTLMTALVRCAALDWSEVEMQICRVVSVLVTYEEDWGLLLKNSLEILTALQSLLSKNSYVKNHMRCRHRGKSDIYCDVHSLIAAALAKLSLVLCADWGKVTAPSYLSSPVFSTSTRTSEVERAREALRVTSNRGGVRPAPKPQSDPCKTLEIVLSIILTMCEGAMILPPTSVNIGTGDNSPKNTGLSVTEALTRSLPLLSNSAAVLCSIALCNLAECPPCVAVLVQGGALRLLRCWLELGTDLMTGVWDALQKDHLAGTDSNDCKSISRVLRSKEYVQAFELLTNAAAAVHYLVGGSDIPGDKNLPATDSTAGFIYAQVMAEGLPAALVRLISASVRDFTTDVEDDESPPSSYGTGESPVGASLRGYNIDTDRDNAELLHLMQMLTVPAALAAVGLKEKEKEKDKGSKKRPMAHILPRAAEVHLAQALCQLSNRVQSRAHLQAVGAPFALCRLFVSSTERSKGRGLLRTPGLLGSSMRDEQGLLTPVSERKGTKNALLFWDEEDEEDDEFDDRTPLTPQTSSFNDLKLVESTSNGNGNNGGNSNGGSAGLSVGAGAGVGVGACVDDDRDMGNDYFANAIMQLSMDNSSKAIGHSPLGSSDFKRPRRASDDVLANHDLNYLKTVNSSCLDALTNFLADDLALRLRSRSHSSADEANKSVLLTPSSVNFTLSSRSPLTEIMAHRAVLQRARIGKR